MATTTWQQPLWHYDNHNVNDYDLEQYCFWQIATGYHHLQLTMVIPTPTIDPNSNNDDDQSWSLGSHHPANQTWSAASITRPDFPLSVHIGFPGAPGTVWLGCAQINTVERQPFFSVTPNLAIILWLNYLWGKLKERQSKRECWFSIEGYPLKTKAACHVYIAFLRSSSLTSQFEAYIECISQILRDLYSRTEKHGTAEHHSDTRSAELTTYLLAIPCYHQLLPVTTNLAKHWLIFQGQQRCESWEWSATPY